MRPDKTHLKCAGVFLVAWLFLPMPTLTHVVVISGIMVLMIANCLFRYFRQQKG